MLITPHLAGRVIITSRVMTAHCITLVLLVYSKAYISANILYFIINQSNRKYLTCAQKVTGSLFIARTNETKRDDRKKTVVKRSSPY